MIDLFLVSGKDSSEFENKEKGIKCMEMSNELDWKRGLCRKKCNGYITCYGIFFQKKCFFCLSFATELTEDENDDDYVFMKKNINATDFEYEGELF